MFQLGKLLAAVEQAARDDGTFTPQPAPVSGGAGDQLSVTEVKVSHLTVDDGGGAGIGMLLQVASATISMRADFGANSLAIAGNKADALRDIALTACRAEHDAGRIARYELDDISVDTERGSAPRLSAEVTFTAHHR